MFSFRVSIILGSSAFLPESLIGTGISIIRPDLVESDNYQEITNLAKKHVEIIKNFKKTDLI